MNALTAHRLGRMLAVLAILAVTVSAATACRRTVPEVSREEAAEGIEERIQATVAELFPAAELVVISRGEDICRTTTRGFEATHHPNLHHGYFLHDVPAARNWELLVAARDWWREQGYDVDRDTTADGGGLLQVRVTDSEGYAMRLFVNARDTLVLEASSPCLRPEDD